MPDSQGFVLVGGAALVTLGLTDRPTEDVDFFTSDAARISHAVAAFTAATINDGGSVELGRGSATFQRIFLTRRDTHLSRARGRNPDGPPRSPMNSPSDDRVDLRAWAASHTRDTYFAPQLWRLKRRIGHKKAVVAFGHSILVICWHLLNNNCDYRDLGCDWFVRRTDRDNHLVRRLHDLGHGVNLTKVA